MSTEQNGQDSGGKSRLDRLEGLMELLIDDHLKFSDEHKKLLTAQVVLTDSLIHLTDRLDRVTERLDRLAEAQAQTEERLNALIAVVDDVVRRKPQ
jgi:hypothetical protein